MDIIESIHPIERIKRIRLSSIEPMDIPDELINQVTELLKCAPHFHIPLQSGNNEILKCMRRGYTTEKYARLVEKIRDAIPDAGITTDVMVGFPGEAEVQFNDTCNFVKAMGFSRLHVFRYSARKGTPAASYPNQIPLEVSTKRCQTLRKIGESLSVEFRLKMLGKNADVLVEDSREGNSKLLAGYTGNYIRTLIDVPDSMIGELIQVRLIRIEDKFMIAAATYDSK